MTPSPSNDDEVTIAQRHLKRSLRLLRAATIFLLLLGVSQPWLWQMTQTQTARLQASSTYDQQSLVVKDLAETINNDYKKDQVILNHLAAVVPVNQDTLPLIERLETLGTETNTAIEVLSIEEGTNLGVAESPLPSPTGKPAAVNKIAPRITLPIFPLVVTIRADGSPASLLNYLARVENMQEMTQIIDFKITTVATPIKESNTFSQSSSLIIKINFYLQRENG